MKTRNILGLILFTVLPLTNLQAQDTTRSRWQAKVTWNYSFYVGGYVQVREFSYAGTYLPLAGDLGTNALNSLSIRISHTSRNNSALALTFEDFFIRGHSVIPDSIWFNGTHLDGSKGLSVNQSWLYHGELYWDAPVRIFRGVETRLGAGLVWDGLEFRIAGTILPGSPKSEPKEDFVTQSLPYPEAGLSIGKAFTPRSSLAFQASGTYIPLFTSFFVEGGHMDLRYYTLNSSLRYTLTLGHYYISPGLQYRLLHTYENSGEDTNDFDLQTFGLTISLGLRF